MKIKIDESKFKIKNIPLRRKSIFKLLQHEENGFADGKWINEETRMNQILFYKKRYQDGLSSLDYKLIKIKNNHLQVEI